MILQNFGTALFLTDRGADVNATDCDGNNLVQSCVQLKHDQHQGGKLVQALLSKGANPNLSFRRPCSESVETPLIRAADLKNYISAQVLLDYGANINAITDTEGPALHVAVSRESSAIVRFFLKRGADPDARGHF